MKTHHKAILGVLAGLALTLSFSEPAHAQGRIALGMETDLDTASLLYRIRGPVSIGVRFGITDTSPAPMLRYTVTNVRSFRFFVHAEANGFELGGKGGKKKKKGKGGKGGGLDGFDFGIGGEYIIKRRLSLFGVVTSGGNFLGLQYYF